jgi:phospholipid N-methyltransferase
MTDDKIDQRLSDEIKSFDNVWGGGYFEGEVLDSVSHSTYGPVGYVSILHALYLMSIKPYVNAESVVLEIGPGRGAFTKAILQHQPKETWCLDAVSAEKNCFYEYVGKQANAKYIQVEDFSCSMLPEDHFNYLFSFGALCHVSFDGITQYLTNLYPKLKKDAECFIMVADYDKFNGCMDNIDNLSIYKNLPFHKLISINWKLYKKRFNKALGLRRTYPESQQPDPGRWFHAGVKQTCDLLRSLGYEVVSEDIGIIQRDPVIHFRKK